MIKKTIRNWFWIVSIYFVALIILGVIIGSFCNDKYFKIFVGLIPLLISLPAAWLGYCIQRRSAYLQQLRNLWPRLIEAIHISLQYTHLEQPTQKEYLDVLIKLSIAIDEVRSLFRNLGENDKDVGFYPFEPLKDIFALIEKLGSDKKHFGAKAKKIRSKIFELWKDVRRELLSEFEREEPTRFHSHWVNLANCKVYEANQIPKTPT